MKLTVGVLIIGSLYWRMDQRTIWRRKRLNAEREWVVRAPIRYGRLSQTRTYTMVFARLTPDQFGQAKVVQCRRHITSPFELVEEAEWLWSAESNRVPRLCTSHPEERISASGRWGCVALLGNPSKPAPPQLLDGWAERVANEPEYAANERRLVNQRGILQIDWPLVDGGGPVPLDLLLATSNDPEDSYPSVPMIANAWNEQNTGAEYFRQNRAHGIHTFQDHEIERLLRL